MAKGRFWSQMDDHDSYMIAKFGLDQLKLVKRDREPFIQKIPTLKKFKQDKIASLERDTEYYLKEIKKAEERERGRLLAYQLIRSEVARILEGGQ